jgi:hypothetical protein
MDDRSAASNSPHLPLEALVRSDCIPCAPALPERLAQVLRGSADMRFEHLRDGVRIFAADEESFANAARLVRGLCGDGFEIPPPAVRLLPGPPQRHPMMNVRISTRAGYARDIRDELERRGARIVEEGSSSRYVVVRALAPMAALFGLPASLAALSDRTAVHWIRLSHYEVLPSSQPPQA